MAHRGPRPAHSRRVSKAPIRTGRVLLRPARSKSHEWQVKHGRWAGGRSAASSSRPSACTREVV